MNSELAKSTREDIEEKVKKIILEHISKDVEKFNSSSKLSEHGADSLDAVEIIMAAEEEFGIEIPDEDAQKMETMEQIVEYINSKAIDLVSNDGIVFLDEIDKIAARTEVKGEVNKEGVQRDLLPLLEGTTVTTKYGHVKTDYILFIASGAFHQSKPSDLLPELQGRLPIRVELKALTQEDLIRILKEPESSLLKQYIALMKTENVTLEFTDDGIKTIAEIAFTVNRQVENIGARRLHLMSKLLESLGAKVNFTRNKDYKANHTLEIDCSNINNHVMSHETASKLRASLLMLGPILSRFGKISTVFPGGCNIGKRPVDMHIKALEEMGAKIEVEGCNIIATVKGKLQGKEVILEKISVGATENVIMAATLAEGVTIINNAATEPEVLDLIEFLKKMGANIEISDTRITITGVEALNGCVHKIIPDRIEAGTYALAAIITGGKLELEGISLSDIRCIVNELKAIGANVEIYNEGVMISRKNCSIRSANIATDPYPNFPSDMQPQLMSAMCIADGISVIEENIFENRFAHVDELRKLGANISIEKSKATISGIKSLSGANLCCFTNNGSKSIE